MKGNVKKSIVTRVRLAFLGVCLFSCAIVWRITQVQFKEGAKWSALEQERRIVYQPVFATRGNIYSDNESIMATSLPFYRVAWDPSVVNQSLFDAKVDSLAGMLAGFFGDRTKSEYKRRLKDAKNAKPSVRYLRLNSRQINFQEKKELAKWPIFREGKNKGGAIFEKVDKRFRPFGGLAQRTIGFVNEDKNGAGLEFTFNRHLAGKDGEALFERLPGGNKPIYDGTEVKPQPGYDVKTTLDINLQDVAENALYKSLVENNAQYGTVILMEVKTGEIKAVANLGKVDEGVYREDYNYAIADQGRTEPGSTFKLASMMAAFEENPDLQLTDTINTGNTGSKKIGGAVKTDSHPYGRITLQQVFEKSSNIGVAMLADQVFGKTPEKYTTYLKNFGLDKPLGFQMAGEARPYIKDPRDRSWSRTSLTTMSIGYELKLAPLQTLAFYNAVANGGVKVQPIIVKEIKQADKVLERFETQVLIPKICSDETLQKVRAMMEGVVEHGTARGIRTNDYLIAGKTGTAWKFKNGAYTRTYSTSFCGYFPADNPKYSCIVVVDSPKNGRIYGADVAAPVFREVADKAMARDVASQRPLLARAPVRKSRVPAVPAGMQEELSMVFTKLGVTHQGATGAEDWVRTMPADSEGESLHLKPLAVRPGRVPNVQGLTLRDALFLLENRGLRVRALGTGRVKTQSVAAGAAARRGTTVVLQLEPIGGRQQAPVPAAPPTPGLATLADGRTPKATASAESHNGGKLAAATKKTAAVAPAARKPASATKSAAAKAAPTPKYKLKA
ncbi:cell division protein FtsI (penicillin-binding protein 3) [Hymenobacter luteus]|uniref:Cell division protein FtsI (Penicillin-binding protein 3) n=2 Tax=Hymenobacter TaxID=89966 RepID=A0A7W9T1A7_9BACT|nr:MULTISPECIES: penicillin-binding protein [Hymenobacter]MBB4600960.1 cell division protein FtsI (penicillin-binding protein 3) [Hymenobacter latericoloratus]MBB6058833.1 cell division protein FtsI (penicillin-binding protein 3) [Hymenobacter luteus]